MITLNDIKNLSNEQINSLNTEQMNAYLKRASTIAKTRRTTTIKQIEKHGVSTSIYSKKPSGYENQSYRYTDFDYKDSEKLQTKKHKLRVIKQFLENKTSTWSGIKQTYSNFTNYLVAISGKHGDKLSDELRKIELKGSRNGLTPKQIKSEQNALIAKYANLELHDKSERKKLAKFDKEKTVKKFWAVYNRIRETFRKEIYGSDSVKELIYNEVTKDLRYGVESLVNRISNILRGDYEEQNQPNKADPFEWSFEF